MIDTTLIDKVPRSVAAALDGLAEAEARRRAAAAAVREADLRLAGLRRQVPAAVKEAVRAGKPTPGSGKVRECEQKLEDAKVRARAAKELLDDARRRLGQEIHARRHELMPQVDVEGDAARALELIDAADSALASLAAKVGTLRAIANATNERVQHRGAEPVRTQRDFDRYGKPSALVSGLRSQVGHLVEVANEINSSAPAKGSDRENVPSAAA